jgi:hypothetical protein
VTSRGSDGRSISAHAGGEDLSGPRHYVKPPRLFAVLGHPLALRTLGGAAAVSIPVSPRRARPELKRGQIPREL